MRFVSRTAVLAATLVVATALQAVASPLVFPLRGEDGFPIDDDPPPVTASSWIIFDESSDIVLAEWDADNSRPMASITKIMTVLLALERGHPDDKVTISEEAAGTGGQEIGLVAGETVELRALVRAALIRSGNDAAAAIAEHIGGSIDGFVALMNQRAAELGMTNTRFANPHGLDEQGHYSSPRDMLALARVAMEIPEFEEIARSRVMVFPDSPTGSQRTATNTNRILNSYEGSIGVKTGETPNAGLTYVGAAERNGRRLYVVVFNSVGRRAHFADAITLFEWGFDDLRINGTLSAGVPYVAADRINGSPLEAEARIESYLHVASQGIVSDTPAPPGGEPIPEPPPVIDIIRRPDPAPRSFLNTLTYWLGLVTGSLDG
ncbi:MAG TPA: D-alanyl-D-alanine carboxypeptidase family protein [Acidimicrobiia bacterium]|jgi:D-alanyl-D-alanine carboxypeptidase|nr:D-alanyl-D-alanine carboxypeptidase family protein [Acidimicrobiia bacterium]